MESSTGTMFTDFVSIPGMLSSLELLQLQRSTSYCKNHLVSLQLAPRTMCSLPFLNSMECAYEYVQHKCLHYVLELCNDKCCIAMFELLLRIYTCTGLCISAKAPEQLSLSDPTEAVIATAGKLMAVYKPGKPRHRTMSKFPLTL